MSESSKIIATVPEDVLKVISNDKVSRVSVLRGVSLKATGVHHKFSPSATLQEAVQWLIDQEGSGVMHTLDFTFLYDNGNGLIFLKGVFSEFENMEEDDE